jgi:hypothetical protein
MAQKLTPAGLLDVPRGMFTVTCSAAGCPNAGHPVTVPADLHDPHVVCCCGVRLAATPL